MINRGECVERLVDIFVQLEMENLQSLMRKNSYTPRDLTQNLMPGAYCLITMNGDITSKFFKDHLDYPVLKSLNNRDKDSFVKQVNKKMNVWINAQDDFELAA